MLLTIVLENTGRRVDAGACLKLPEQRAVGGVQGCKTPVVAADEQQAALRARGVQVLLIDALTAKPITLDIPKPYMPKGAGQ